VPANGDPARLLETAGFQQMKVLKFDANPCFVRDGVPLREQQMECFKPGPSGEQGI
jgi:hypothetical protein